MRVTSENYMDAASALHWYCVNHHDGQFGVLYLTMCKLDYTPGQNEIDLHHVIFGMDDYAREDSQFYLYLLTQSSMRRHGMDRFVQVFQKLIHRAAKKGDSSCLK